MRARLKHLTTGVAIYGAGEAAMQVVNFLLLRVYVQANFLTTADFGALAIIGSIEAFTKVVSRWGLDGAFMRFYHERDEGEARRCMTSTIVWFMLAANGVLLLAALAGAGPLARWVWLAPAYVPALRLMFINMFLMAFTFVPFHSMRLRNQAVTFSAFIFARSLASIILRVVLIIGLRMGITGTYLTDLIITVVLLPLMWPWFRSLIGLSFSWQELRGSLRFGLPRLPHGLASQVLDGNPKLMLGRTVSQERLGVYQNGVTLGTGVSFFKNAFETAFAPFYYATSREPDAKQIFSKLATYGVAVFVLLVAGTIAVARDVIMLLLTPEYLQALPVVPLVATAFALQGVYQLTSIGINLTGRTEFYSVGTLTAALVSLASGAVLIPRFGIVGAAVTVLVSYATQVSVAFVLTQRLYRVHYETWRLLRLLLAGVAATLTALWAIPPIRPIIDFVTHGVTTVAVYGAVLWLTGFFRATERRFLMEMFTKLRRRLKSGGPGGT